MLINAVLRRDDLRVIYAVRNYRMLQVLQIIHQDVVIPNYIQRHRRVNVRIMQQRQEIIVIGAELKSTDVPVTRADIRTVIKMARRAVPVRYLIIRAYVRLEVPTVA